MTNGISVLKSGVDIQQLYASKATAAQIAAIKKAADGGFTQAELDSLTQMGIDINPLVSNFETEGAGEADTNGNNITAGQIATVIAELKEKYSAEAGGKDHYTMSNPQLKAFQQAINDGVIADLGNAGYSKAQIIEVVNAVFPSIGIAATASGGYTCPYGHDTEAKALYEQFTQELIAAAGTSPEIQALQQEITSLNLQITSNNSQLQTLKPLIEKLQAEIEDTIEKAINESEEIAEDQKEEAARIVKSELEAFTSAEGEMSYEDFQSNLGYKLDALSSDGNSKMSQVIRNMMNAESKMDTLKAYVAQMGSLIKENAQLSDQVSLKAADLTQLKAELSAEDDPDCQKCDPIGFTSGSSRYDFFVDKDSDGKLSNEKEFLGAQDGWNEMVALDKNGDGKVTKDEMSGLKMVVTNADGTQSIQNASELFSDNDAINLKSYEAVNQDMSNGNTLLGTFDLTFNGQEIDDGYNTLDKIDWLDNNYEFSDKDNGINRFAKDEYQAQEALDFNDVFTEFESNANALDAKISDAWSKIGIERDEVKSKIVNSARASAESKADVIDENFKQIAKQKEAQELAAEKAEEQEELQRKKAQQGNIQSATV